MLGMNFRGLEDRISKEHQDAIEEMLEQEDTDLLEEEEEQVFSLLDERTERGIEELIEDVAPGFRRPPKEGDLELEPRNIFEIDPAPGEKLDDPWQGPLYEPEEYEPDEYRHALVA